MRKYAFLAMAFLLIANTAYAQLGRCADCGRDTPVVKAPEKCNTFLFDGTKPFDPDKESISFIIKVK